MLNNKIFEDCINNQNILLFNNNVRLDYLTKAFEKHFPSLEWILLLDAMLNYTPDKRISIDQVLNNQVFEEVKVVCDQVFIPESIKDDRNYNLDTLTEENLLQIKSILSYIHNINNISLEALFIAIELSLKIFTLIDDIKFFRCYI